MVDALSPKETLLPSAKLNAVPVLLVVPAENLTDEISPAVDGTVYDAVTRVDPLSPKLMPFESEKTTVPEVAVCVPAASAPGAVDCE
jgi:hypothetical protein